MKTQLIVTCDDCGLSEGVNQAAVDLFKKGIITTGSIMMNCPATEHAFALFDAHPGLNAGVHLNLTEGYPLSHLAVPSPLVDSNGKFRGREFLFGQSFTSRSAFVQQIEMECEAQIKAFLQHGRQPEHITTHMHFHLMPALAKIVFKLAQKYKVAWVRAATPETSYIPLNPLWAKGIKPEKYDDIMTPDHEVAMMAWLLADPKWLANKIRGMDGVTEIIVHAAIDPDDTFPDGMSYAPSERAREVVYLEKVFAYLRAGKGDSS